MQMKIFLAISALVLTVSLLYKMKDDPAVASRPPLMNKSPIVQSGSRNVANENDGAKRRKNSVIVKLKADATAEQIENLRLAYEEYDLKNEKQLLNGKAVRLKIAKGSYSDQEMQVARALRDTGAVEIAEPDYFVPLAFTPNDSLYSYQWHHGLIQTPIAWDITQGSSSILVAVCDAGFDLSHPDLAARFVLPGYNTVKNNTAIDNINDHGTAAAGVLAAIGNNNTGVTGVAWQVKILPIQITDRADGVSSYSDVAECISYASSKGAKVVNISYDSTYTSAIVNDAALAMRNAGGTVVVAAGNSTIDISPWGASPNLIVVGATDAQDKLAWFSNFGGTVDLYAPGLDLYSTTKGGNYNLVSGTSFATPVVAGTFALIYSVKASFSASQVESFVLGNLKSIGLPTGRIDAGAAVTKAYQSVQMQTAPIIIDNLAAGQSDASHTSLGRWCPSTFAGSHGMASLNSCGRKVDTYRFIPNISTAGVYNVFIRYTSHSGLSTRVNVITKSLSGMVTKPVNMQTGGGTWVLVGTYNLALGTTNYVEVNDAAGAANVDAMKLEFVP